VGFRNSKKLVDTLIQLHQPAVILLQDCRVRKDRIKEATAEARKRWPEYKIFMLSSERVSRSRCERTGREVRRYQMAVATLVHRACGEAVDCDLKGGEEEGYDKGRMLTVKVRRRRKTDVYATNVYNHTASEGRRQGRLLEAVRGRIERTIEQKCVHVVGGDWNAGLFPELRRGYSGGKEETQEADVRFAEFVGGGTLKGGWWAGNVTEGLLTRRYTLTGHQALLDEILIHNGEDLGGGWEERREGGHSYVLRTAHPGAVEYDHGTLYAEITSQLFPQPRKAKKSREVRRVDRKKWEEEAAEWAKQGQKQRNGAEQGQGGGGQRGQGSGATDRGGSERGAQEMDHHRPRGAAAQGNTHWRRERRKEWKFQR
jgi:hypothetical protein